MTRDENQAALSSGSGMEILGTPPELDITTADGLAKRGCDAIARRPRLLLLDLTGLSFCDARGLGAFVRIANRAEATGCRYGLIAPQPPVVKALRITGLNRRISVFATIDDALQADLPAMTSASAR